MGIVGEHKLYGTLYDFWLEPNLKCDNYVIPIPMVAVDTLLQQHPTQTNGWKGKDGKREKSLNRKPRPFHSGVQMDFVFPSVDAAFRISRSAVINHRTRNVRIIIAYFKMELLQQWLVSPRCSYAITPTVGRTWCQPASQIRFFFSTFHQRTSNWRCWICCWLCFGRRKM